MLIMGKHIFENVKFQWHSTYNTGAILIYFIKRSLTMRISTSMRAVTMLEGHFVFLTDNPSKAVSTWLRRWFLEVLCVRTGWNQDQECYRLQRS